MIFRDAFNAEVPPPIPTVRIGGDPRYPFHYVMNMRERALPVSALEFRDWLAMTGIQMVFFFNTNNDLRAEIVQCYTANEMTCQEVVAWLSSIDKDTITPSNQSFGFQSEADRLAFKLRWF